MLDSFYTTIESMGDPFTVLCYGLGLLFIMIAFAGADELCPPSSSPCGSEAGTPPESPRSA
eukprot:3596663-Alexandrium_andersonii.AAC.1